MPQKHGKILWFDQAKGFGFIECSDGTELYFNRSGVIDLKGRSSLYEDDHVEFKAVPGIKGPQAEDICFSVQ